MNVAADHKPKHKVGDVIVHIQSHRVITTGLVTGNCVMIASCAFTLYNHNECEPTSKCGNIEKVP